MAWVSGYQVWLTEDQSLQNAQLVSNHFNNTDWTPESLSAMCGNMRHESSINPEMYEYGKTWDEDRGYGLVQWTPRSKYWDWAVANNLQPENGDSQLARIDYEIQNNIQWVPNGHSVRYGLETKYDITFAEFRSNVYGYTVDELTEAFMWNYEGPAYTAGSESLFDRQAFANRVFNEVVFGEGGGGSSPSPNPDDKTDKRKALIHMYLANTFNGWG